METIGNLDDVGISCGGTRITNLRFADDIDLIGKDEAEIQELTNRLHKASKKFGMEINRQKSKIMVSGNHNNEVKLEIDIEGEKLEQVKSFKYLGSTITENGGSEEEIRSRIGISTSAMIKLSTVFNLKEIHLKSRLKITKAIVWATLLYGCESWTINQKSMDRLKAFEMKCYRRMLKITWKEKKTNDFVWRRVTEILGKRPESIEEIIKRRKLKFYGHQIRKQALAKVMIEGRVEGERPRGRPKRQWIDDLKEWSGLSMECLRKEATNREMWRRLVYNWVHPRPNG